MDGIIKNQSADSERKPLKEGDYLSSSKSAIELLQNFSNSVYRNSQDNSRRKFEHNESKRYGEYEYLNLLQDILNKGKEKGDRTGNLNRKRLTLSC